MGFDYHAFGLIGIEVDPKIFETGTQRVKAFKHNHPETMDFDPKTGKKLWENEVLYHPEYDDDEGDEPTFAGFNVHSNCNDDTFIAIASTGVARGNGDPWYNTMKIPDDLEAQKAKLKAILEPLGAWDEKKFGFYAVLDGG